MRHREWDRETQREWDTREWHKESETDTEKWETHKEKIDAFTARLSLFSVKSYSLCVVLSTDIHLCILVYLTINLICVSICSYVDFCLFIYSIVCYNNYHILCVCSFRCYIYLLLLFKSFLCLKSFISWSLRWEEDHHETYFNLSVVDIVGKVQRQSASSATEK